MADEDLGKVHNNLDNSEKDKIISLKNEGNAFYKKCCYDEALNCYSKAINIDPNNLDLLNNIAMVLEKLGKSDEAEKVRGIITDLKNRSVSPPEPTPITQTQPISPPKTPIRFCKVCSAELTYPNTETCPSCERTGPSLPKPSKIRNPTIAMVFSALCPGWGQWYNGRTWDGIKFFGAFLLTWVLYTVVSSISSTFAGIFIFVLLGLWVFGVDNAYQTATKINQHKIKFSRKSKLFWLALVPTIIILFIVVMNAVGFINAETVIYNPGDVVGRDPSSPFGDVILNYDSINDTYSIRSLTMMGGNWYLSDEKTPASVYDRSRVNSFDRYKIGYISDPANLKEYHVFSSIRAPPSINQN